MNHATLKARQRAERHNHPPNLALRVHRALSWLQRAEQLADDPDGRFIFLWIAFNAAYATHIDDTAGISERTLFREFLAKLCRLDAAHRIEALVWDEFAGNIRVLLDNPYIFRDFWLHQTGSLAETEWKKNFAGAKAAAHRALSRRETATVLSAVLSRIYTLRNQLVHGGATWSSSVNRDQVRDGGNLLAKLVPLVIEIMMDNVTEAWPAACYPVVA